MQALDLRHPATSVSSAKPGRAAGPSPPATAQAHAACLDALECLSAQRIGRYQGNWHGRHAGHCKYTPSFRLTCFSHSPLHPARHSFCFLFFLHKVLSPSWNSIPTLILILKIPRAWGLQRAQCVVVDQARLPCYYPSAAAIVASRHR